MHVERLEDRQMMATLLGLSVVGTANSILTFDSDTPGTIDNTRQVTGLQGGETLLGIDVRPATGGVYALGSSSRLYTINIASGAATQVGAGQFSTLLEGTTFGFDFNPTVDLIRVVSDTEENLRINPTTGALTMVDSDLAPPGFIATAAYDRNIASTGATQQTTLLAIDHMTDMLVRIGGVNGNPSPNLGAVTNIGATGLNTVDGPAGFDIDKQGNAFAVLQQTGETFSRLFTINQTTGAATNVGPIGNGTLVLSGLTALEESILAIGADAGGGPRVRVLDAQTNEELLDFFAYDSNFKGGVRVATGDFNRDGFQDIVTGAGPTGGPHVRVFDGRNLAELRSFLAYGAGFTGGVTVAAGDINGDGVDDIITGADAGGGPHVKVFSGTDGSVLQSFFAFAPTFGGGVRVSVGDFNGDGRQDIITGAGAGGGPHLRVFNGVDNALLLNTFAFGSGFQGGLWVASGDVNGDGRDDILVGAGAGGGPHVKVFSGLSGGLEVQSFFAYDAGFRGGVTVATADVDGDGRLDIITGAGPGGSPHVRAFDGIDLDDLDSFFAFEVTFAGGVHLGSRR